MTTPRPWDKLDRRTTSDPGNPIDEATTLYTHANGDYLARIYDASDADFILAAVALVDNLAARDCFVPEMYHSPNWRETCECPACVARRIVEGKP